MAAAGPGHLVATVLPLHEHLQLAGNERLPTPRSGGCVGNGGHQPKTKFNTKMMFLMLSEVSYKIHFCFEL